MVVVAVFNSDLVFLGPSDMSLLMPMYLVSGYVVTVSIGAFD